MEKRERSFVPGIVLIVIGFYFLLKQLGVFFYFRMYQIYPIGLIVLGAFFLVLVFTKKDKGAAFAATVFLVLGVFFFLRNFVFLPHYLDHSRNFWPIFLIAPGLGFIVLYLFKRQDWGVLIPGAILLFLGISAFLEISGLYYWEDFTRYWPVILIVIGLGIVVSSLRRKPE